MKAYFQSDIGQFHLSSHDNWQNIYTFPGRGSWVSCYSGKEDHLKSYKEKIQVVIRFMRICWPNPICKRSCYACLKGQSSPFSAFQDRGWLGPFEYFLYKGRQTANPKTWSRPATPTGEPTRCCGRGKKVSFHCDKSSSFPLFTLSSLSWQVLP